MLKVYCSILLFLVAGFLSACNQDVVTKATYACAGNMLLETTFTNGKTLEIQTEGEILLLTRAESASGAKYEAEGLEFWSKGKDATFKSKAGTTNCQRR